MSVEFKVIDGGDAGKTYTIAEAAILLKLSTSTVKRRIRSGKLHSLDGKIPHWSIQNYQNTGRSKCTSLENLTPEQLYEFINREAARAARQEVMRILSQTTGNIDMVGS